jgi:hypothetical protein
MSASSTKLKEPNILLAASNCRRLLRNLEHVLDAGAVQSLQAEIDRNVIALFRLGDDQLEFARGIAAPYWRQRISRLYYGAYNVRRAIALHHDGHFAMDSSDHKNVGDLPKDFPNANTFEARLQTLRDDRNLADYNHLAELGDLMASPADVETLVVEFRDQSHSYLLERGLHL